MSLNAKIVDKILITENLFILKVKPDTEIPDFLPGQYIALGVPGDYQWPERLGEEENPPKDDKIIKRSYSIGSAPNQKDFYEFYVAVVNDGVLSPRLSLLEKEERLFIGRKPIGAFNLDGVPDASNVYFVSTGTGIAPFISMLREGRVLSKMNKVTLINGVRYKQDFAYDEELENLEKEYSHFKYLKTVSRPDDTWEGRKGYVQEFFDEIEVNPKTDHIMLCGNPAMIEDLEVRFAEAGFKEHKKRDPGNLHLEKYW